MLVPIILSSGAGTRLWPLSRGTMPKPFLPLPDGETLLAKTFARAAGLRDVASLLTITHHDYYVRTRDEYARTSVALPPRMIYLLEPFGRNTAPAVALGALCAEAAVGANATLLVLPADHLIRDLHAFAVAVERAASVAQAGWLVTFGIEPSHPEAGYGYIACGDALGIRDAFRVDRFIEKPPAADAIAFLAAGHHLWNSGIFCFTPAAILRAFEQHAPAVLDALRPVWQALQPCADAPKLEIDPALFAPVPDISLDYAVMERATNLAVVRGSFDWCDVGSWQAFAALSEPDAAGNRGQGTRVAIATRDTFVHAGERVVATVGIENLVIVDTPDALLVAHVDQLQRVREVVDELKARGHDSCQPQRIAQPWGTSMVLQDGPGFKVLRIEIKPGGTMPLRLHRTRSKHWVVIHGEAQVTNGERFYALRASESTGVAIETAHRLANRGNEPLTVIEVQCGESPGEDEIALLDVEERPVET